MIVVTILTLFDWSALYFFLRSELDAEVEAFEGEYDEMQAEAEASEYGTMEGQMATRETLGVDELAILSEAIYRFKITTI